VGQPTLRTNVVAGETRNGITVLTNLGVNLSLKVGNLADAGLGIGNFENKFLLIVLDFLLINC
jgi:hypothetical protein